MRKMEKEKVCEKMEKELSALMDETKLTPNALDNAFKMVDIIKDIKNMEYWDKKCEYYKNLMGGEYSRENGEYSRNNEDYSRDNYDNENSYRRGRNQRTGEYMHRPNYSRLSGDDTDMDRYKEDKRQYSNSRDGGDKERMLDSLERLVVNVCDMVVQIDRDCDCVDERDIIFKHVKNLYDKLRR